MGEYLKRVHKRLIARAMRADDDTWKTINGTHVMVETGTGEIKKGPSALKAVSKNGGAKRAKQKEASNWNGGYSNKSEAYKTTAEFVKKEGIPLFIRNMGRENKKDVFSAIADYGKLNETEKKIFDKIRYSENEHRIWYNGASSDVEGLSDNEIRGAKMFLARAADAHRKANEKKPVTENNLPIGSWRDTKKRAKKNKAKRQAVSLSQKGELFNHLLEGEYTERDRREKENEIY